MELDNVNLGKITSAERERLRKIGGCFRCRRPGHFSRECPRFASRRRPRQLHNIESSDPESGNGDGA
ncbi:hypothetical protein BGW41_008038, partial [Actinomortierella wolfii]